MSERKTLVLVDGSALAFRSFFALINTGMRTSDGTPTWAVYGFFSALFDLIEKREPEAIAVCFDLAAPTFRHEEFEDYKAHRAEMPDELSAQWPLIKEGVALLNVPLYEMAGFEADDVIGTVAKVAEEKEWQVLILTGDQDAFQLLDGNIQVLMPSSREGLLTYGRQEVFNKLGVWPEQVIDYKGLCGDTSDNIPGVRGIGPKTAVQLLSQYATIEGIYENLEKISSASVRAKLSEGRQSAFASKRLATIRLDVPLSFDFEHCQLSLPQVEAVAMFFRRLEANAMLKRLPRVLKDFNQGIMPAIDDAWLEPVTKARGRLAAKQEPRAGRQATAASGCLSPESVPATHGTGSGSSQAEPVPQAKISFLPVIHQGAPEPSIIVTAEQLADLLGELSQQSLVSVVAITDSAQSLDGNLVGLGLAWSDCFALDAALRLCRQKQEGALKAVYVPLAKQGLSQPSFSAEEALSSLKPYLEDRRIGKVMHNAKQAMNALSLYGVELGPIVFDSSLASYIANPDDKHGLKEQARNILGYSLVSLSDLAGSGRKQLTADLLALDRVAFYAADACRINLELACYWTLQLDSDQLYLLFEMDLPLTSVLARMEQTGVKLDVPYFEEFSAELKGELVRLEKEIFDLSGHPFNINSPLQLQKVLFEELKLPTKGKTKSGYSTDASVLDALKDEHEIVAKILDYRQVTKLNSTYVEALPRQISARDGFLHCEFNQTVTATGRLSSTNPNLQNIPIRTELGHRIRKGFIPARQGNVLLSADYSQIELRLLAHMSGDERLIQAFQENQDIHAATAADIFGIEPSAVTPELRRVGKTLNFALIYQQGAYSTAQDLGVSTRQAQDFIEKYFANYPRVRQFRDGIIEEARKRGYVQTLWGRRRYFLHLNDRNEGLRKMDERAACNAPLQGSAADLIKLAMIRLDRELTCAKLAARPIMQVHDELVLDVPESELAQAREITVCSMLLDQPLNVPLKIDVSVGRNWKDTE